MAERHPCACGCAGLASPGRKFIHNHHARTDLNPFRQLRFTGKKNHFYGRKHTEKSIAKMSLAKQGSKGLAGSDNPAWRGGKVVLTCEHCGKELERWPSNIRNHTYCSRRCSVAGRDPRRGERHWNWKGGYRDNGNGYVIEYEPDNSMADKHGYVSEHRKVMAEILGRPLESREIVHHINRDRSDNRRENLMLFASNAEHLRITARSA